MKAQKFKSKLGVDLNSDEQMVEMLGIAQFSTEYAKDKWKRDLTIYKEFQSLTSIPGSSKSEVTKYLMKKYNLHSAATVWNIRKRIENRFA